MESLTLFKLLLFWKYCDSDNKLVDMRGHFSFLHGSVKMLTVRLTPRVSGLVLLMFMRKGESMTSSNLMLDRWCEVLSPSWSELD